MRRQVVWFLLFACITTSSLTGCATAGLYKESTKAYAEVTQRALESTSDLLDEYESVGLARQGASITAAEIATAARARDLVGYDHPGSDEIQFARDVIRALEAYAKALKSITALGSAKSAGDSLNLLGSTLDNAGVDNAGTYGSLAKTVSTYLIDRKVSKSAKDAIQEAAPMVDQFTTYLEDSSRVVATATKADYEALVGRLLVDLRGRISGPDDAEEYVFTDGSSFDISLILSEMRVADRKAGQLDDVGDQTADAMEAMRAAHQRLVETSRKRNKAALVAAIAEFASTVDDLHGSLEKL